MVFGWTLPYNSRRERLTLTFSLSTTAYSSVLVSFIIAPHYRPLVDTLEDLAQRENVNPLVVQDLAADVTISV